MKRSLLTCLAIALAASITAQTVLTLESHGLIPGQKNDMTLTEYIEPGSSGNNVVWDFTRLALKADFVGSLEEAIYAKNSQAFGSANTVLEEFGNNFFFDVNVNSIELHGFASASGATQIVYEKPFVKMRYPFSYGSGFTGAHSGKYYSNQREIGVIDGSYSVQGDGQGTLLLPGNLQYKNALRVKEVKSYTQTLNTRSVEIENTTYRWYVKGHRFPILVFIKSEYTYPDGRTSVSTQAAYNSVIIADAKNPLSIAGMDNDFSLKAYPNPYHDRVNIRFALSSESNVSLSVYDLNGRMVKTLINGKLSAGEQTHTFSANELGLASGAYILKLNANGSETTLRLIEQ